MSAMVDRDPDRVPGAPPGYRPITAGLGSCNRCGAAVNINDPVATNKHAEFHQSLRAMWATARSSSPPGPNEQEASPTQAGRSRTGGPNHSSSERGGRPGTDAASPPAGPTPPGPAGTTRRGRPGRTGPGTAASSQEPEGWR